MKFSDFLQRDVHLLIFLTRCLQTEVALNVMLIDGGGF